MSPAEAFELHLPSYILSIYVVSTGCFLLTWNHQVSKAPGLCKRMYTNKKSPLKTCHLPSTLPGRNWRIYMNLCPLFASGNTEIIPLKQDLCEKHDKIVLRMVFKMLFLTLQSILGEMKAFYFSARSRVLHTSVFQHCYPLRSS